MKLASIVLAIAGLAWLANSYQFSRTRRLCRCGHEHVAEGTTLGPVHFGDSEATTRSLVAAHLLDSSHKHEWEFGTRNLITLFSQTVSCELNNPNCFTYEFNHDSGFRAHVLAMIESGSLTREVAAKIALTDSYGETPDALLGESIVTEFFGDD